MVRLAPRLPHVRSKIGQLMIGVAIVALVLTPFAWSSPGLVVVEMILIMASPFLLERLEGGHEGLRPRTAKAKPLPRLLRSFTWAPPPHRRGSSRL